MALDAGSIVLPITRPERSSDGQKETDLAKRAKCKARRIVLLGLAITLRQLRSLNDGTDIRQEGVASVLRNKRVWEYFIIIHYHDI